MSSYKYITTQIHRLPVYIVLVLYEAHIYKYSVYILIRVFWSDVCRIVCSLISFEFNDNTLKISRDNVVVPCCRFGERRIWRKKSVGKKYPKRYFLQLSFFHGNESFWSNHRKKGYPNTWIRKPRPRTSVFISLCARSTHGNDSVAQGFFMYVSHFYNCQDED